MKRFSQLFVVVFIALAGSAASAIADEPSAGQGLGHGGGRHRVRHFERCLTSVGLSADQQTAVQSIQSEFRAAHQADFAAVKAAREKLEADRASGADTGVLGQDKLDQDAAAAKLKSGLKATHDEIVAKLNPDQQTALSSCMQQRRGSGDADQQ